MDLCARTLEALDWPFIAAALADHARTAAGRRAAAGVPFLASVESILESFDAVDEVHALAGSRSGIPPVGGIEEIDDALARASRGEVLDLADIATVRATLAGLVELRIFLSQHHSDAPTLARIGGPIAPDRRLCAAYEAALDEHGELSEKAWPQLGDLRRRIASLERTIRTTLETLLDSAEYADLLQDRYVTTRADRFVLPIKAHAKGLGLGIVHDSSRSERTVFIEPAAIVPIGNERRIAEAALREEERRILGELSALASTHAESLACALEAAAALDLACARADFAVRLGAARPAVGRDGIVSLVLARHPVLALSLPAVVANDLGLDDGRPVLVLTGPNAGGKTVAMKTIGLCALLVRAGCFVPAAAGSRVDLFDPVLADIGDMQTVHEGLSSFSAHLATLREMLEMAGRGSLLLLDEIAAGTDPAQGGALARAIIERFAAVGARVVATTHYSQVKAMGTGDARVEVAALEYREGRPTYRVVPGAVGESHALAAALRTGIDPALVERARELMDEGERALADALAALEEQKAEAAETSRRAAVLESELRARETAVARRENEIAIGARQAEKRKASALVDRMRAAEDDVQRALAALREEATRERAAKARTAIEAARALAEHARRDEESPRRDARPGDRVRVSRLGITGEVTSMRDAEIEVRSGALTMRVKADEIEILASQKKTPPPRGQRHERDAGRASLAAASEAVAAPDWLDSALRTPTNTLDLRGARVEEAVARLETFLDDSMLEGRDFVFILHGHGTGALKSAIRRVLADSAYVSASAPAPEDQGGDALTVSRLRG